MGTRLALTQFQPQRGFSSVETFGSGLDIPDFVETHTGFSPGLFAVSGNEGGGGITHLGLLRSVQKEQGEEAVFRTPPQINVYPTSHHDDYNARELPNRKALATTFLTADSRDYTPADYARLIQTYLDTSPALQRFRHMVPESVIAAQGTLGVLQDLKAMDKDFEAGEIDQNNPFGTSFAEQYFGQDINPGLDVTAQKGIRTEVDRNVVMFLCMKWLYDGNYEAFTACQKEDVKITEENFNQISNFVRGILDNHPEFLEALFFNFESNPYGKTKWVKEAVDKAGFQFSGEFQKAMWLYAQIFSGEFENYMSLTDAQRLLVLNGYDTIINLGQIIQGEGAEYQFLGLQGKTTDMVQYWLVLAISKIAGAAGQFNPNGSLVLNNANAIKIIAAIQAMHTYFRNQDSTEAYHAFLDTLAQVFGYDVEDVLSRPSLRLSFMVRNVSDYGALKDAVAGLPRALQDTFIAEMNRTHDQGTQALLFYAPTFLEVLQKQDEFQDLALADQYKLQALFIAQAYGLARQEIDDRGITSPKFTIDFNSLSEELKSLDPEQKKDLFQRLLNQPEETVVALEFDATKKGYKIKLS